MSEIGRGVAPQEPTQEMLRKDLPTSGTAGAAIGQPAQRASKSQPAGGLQRTAGAIRTIVPLAQKLLPLLDGNVASVVANLLAPRLPGPPAIDLAPLETSLTKLRGELAVMHDKHAQQDVAFRRIDDQLGKMKEALERTAMEQQEVAQEVGKVRRSVLVLWLIGVGLVVVSIGLNAAVFLYVKGILR